MRILLIIVLLLGAVVPSRASQLFDQLKQEYQAKAEIELVAGGETFPATCGAGQINGKNVTTSEIDLCLYLFRKELGKYPKELLTAILLKRVVFCRELSLNAQPRAAVADWDHGALYLEVRSGVYADGYRRKMIHHELFHLEDFADDGVLGGDAEWVALNPADFHYGNDVKLDEKSAAPSRPIPGFFSSYSRVSVAEDKAETFANLMVYDVKVTLLLKQDSILVSKVQQLKTELTAFCPQVDAHFWANAAKF